MGMFSSLVTNRLGYTIPSTLSYRNFALRGLPYLSNLQKAEQFTASQVALSQSKRISGALSTGGEVYGPSGKRIYSSFLQRLLGK